MSFGHHLFGFLNGALIGSDTAYYITQDTTPSFKLGKGWSPNFQWFKGSMNNIRMYSRALSDDEVKAHYRGARLTPTRLLTPVR